MKTTFLLLLHVAFPLLSAAQAPLVWRGGMPGRTTDWHCPENWQTGRVPGPFDSVLIPDVGASGGFTPVITRPAGTIRALTLLSGGRLYVHPHGSLDVEMPAGADDFTVLGTLRVDGVLTLREQAVSGGTAVVVPLAEKN